MAKYAKKREKSTLIISASRRTDIPAFYFEWFLNRLREGFALVRNPMNPNQVSRVSLDRDIVECIVFWSKNPAPMLPLLDRLAGYHFYVQFTLNPYDYDMEGELPQTLPQAMLPPGCTLPARTLPKKQELLDTFRRLADAIGPERVVWRYSPALFNARYTEEFHLEKFSRFAQTLHGYTRQCKLSFLDIYPKIRKNMAECGVLAREPELANSFSPGKTGYQLYNRLIPNATAISTDLFDFASDNASGITRQPAQLAEGLKSHKNRSIELNLKEALAGSEPSNGVQPDSPAQARASAIAAQLPPAERLRLARRFQAIAAAHGITTGICGDSYLTQAGFPAANCVDRELIERITGTRLRIRKDPGQRDECACVESADIGAYDTCLHGCRYCYANRSVKAALAGMRAHDPFSPLLHGQAGAKDKISERKVKMHALAAKEKPGQQQFSLF